MKLSASAMSSAQKDYVSPAMLVVKLHLQADDTELAELLWFDANFNARRITLETGLLEHVPQDGR